jgi:hypothetical protein
MNDIPQPVLISRGPAFVQFNGGSFFTKGDLKFDFGVTQKPIESSAFGNTSMMTTKIAPRLTCPLLGAIENLATLFPFGAMMVGASIFAANGGPLIITPLDTTQKQITFAQAAVFKEPTFTGGPDSQAFGDLIFCFLPTAGQPLTATNAWFAEGDNTWDGTGYDAGTIVTQAYLASWLSQGTSTFTWGGDTTAAFAFDEAYGGLSTAFNALASVTGAGGVTVAGDYRNGYTITYVTNGARAAIVGAVSDMPAGMGWKQTVIQTGTSEVPAIVLMELTPWGQFSTEETMKVETSPKITEAPSSQIGPYDYIFGGTGAKATLLPVNIPQTTLLAASNIQGSASGLGTAPVPATTADLSIYAEGLYITLYAATLKPTTMIRGASKQLVGAMEFNSGGEIAAGINTHYYVGTEAPE